MTTEEAYKILKEYNLWRRGKGKYDKVTPIGFSPIGYTPSEIGEAIDVAVKVLKERQSTTNAEKYKTAEERNKAFAAHCNRYDYCDQCPIESCHAECPFYWLELEAEEETNDNK